MIFAPQIHTKTVSEVRNISVSFSGLLDDVEILTGTPSITVISPSESPEVLTFSDIAINSSIIPINGVDVPIGEAVTLSASSGTANAKYEIEISSITNATPSQTFKRGIILNVVAD